MDKNKLPLNPIDHLPLVTIVMKQLNIPPYLWEDMRQEGVLGILNALKTYNPTLGFKQSTHVSAHIKYSILRALRSLRGRPNHAKGNLFHVDLTKVNRIQEGYDYPYGIAGELAKTLSYHPEYYSNVIYHNILEELDKLSQGDNGIFVQCYLLYAMEGKTLREIKESLHLDKAINSICRMVNRGRIIVCTHLRETYIEVFNHVPVQDIIKEIKRWAVSDLDIKRFLVLCIEGEELPSDHKGVVKIKEKYPNSYKDIISTLQLGKQKNKIKNCGIIP